MSKTIFHGAVDVTAELSWLVEGCEAHDDPESLGKATELKL